MHFVYLFVHLKLVLGERLQVCPGGSPGKVVLGFDEQEEVVEEKPDQVLGSSDLGGRGAGKGGRGKREGDEYSRKDTSKDIGGSF